MTRKILTYLAVVVLAVVLGQQASAQGGPGDSKVRQELERTDELITQAKEAIRSASNPLAGQTLQQAIEFQRLAWDAFDRNLPVLALNQTRKARESAQKALSLCRNAEQLESVVLRRLERAGELLDRVGEELSPQTEGAIQTLYDNARDNLARAWEFYRNLQYRPALKLADQAEKAAQRLAGQLQLEERGTALYERRREHVSDMLEQAATILTECSSESAAVRIARAREALDMADGLHGKKNDGAAVQAVRRAQDLIGRAIRDCQGSEQLEQRLERLQARTDRATEKLAELDAAKAEVATKLLEQAREQLSIARNELAANRVEAALTSLQAAQLVLRQAERYISGDK
jgi:flagellin-specific chaperone FliS